MNPLRPVSLLLLASVLMHAQEPDYETELQRAIKQFPPGDYDWMGVAPTVIARAKVEPVYNLLEYVEPSDKNIETLFSEAADYFASGRWGLSMTRYKQVLLSDPENLAAKANLYDLLLLRSLYADGRNLNEATQKHLKMHERLLKDIIPKK